MVRLMFVENEQHTIEWLGTMYGALFGLSLNHAVKKSHAASEDHGAADSGDMSSLCAMLNIAVSPHSGSGAQSLASSQHLPLGLLMFPIGISCLRRHLLRPHRRGRAAPKDCSIQARRARRRSVG